MNRFLSHLWRTAPRHLILLLNQPVHCVHAACEWKGTMSDDARHAVRVTLKSLGVCLPNVPICVHRLECKSSGTKLQAQVTETRISPRKKQRQPSLQEKAGRDTR